MEGWLLLQCPELLPGSHPVLLLLCWRLPCAGLGGPCSWGSGAWCYLELPGLFLVDDGPRKSGDWLLLASSSVHDSRTNAFAIGCWLHAYSPAVESARCQQRSWVFRLLDLLLYMCSFLLIKKLEQFPWIIPCRCMGVASVPCPCNSWKQKDPLFFFIVNFYLTSDWLAGL